MSRQPVATPTATQDALAMLACWWARAMSPSVDFLATELRWQRDRTERVVHRLVRDELVYVVARTGRLVPGPRWARPAWMAEAGMTLGPSGLSREAPSSREAPMHREREAGAIRLGLALVMAVVLVALAVLVLVATAHTWVPVAGLIFLAALVAHGQRERRGRGRRRHHHLGRDAVVGGLAWELWRRHRDRARASTWSTGPRRPGLPVPSTVATGDGFEAYVAHVLAANDWALVDVGAHVRGTAGDGGVDLAGRDPSGRAVVVQCKAIAGSLGAPVVRDLLGARALAGAEVAVLATTGTLTTAAADTARAGAVLVLDGPRLARLAGMAGRRGGWPGTVEPPRNRP